MEVLAKSSFVRQTPRKLRLVANQIRGLKATEAEVLLENLNKRAAEPLLLTLRQGIANATNNFGLKKEELKVKRVEIGEGPRYRRVYFTAHGRVHWRLKRTGHIRLVLEGGKNGAKS